MVHYGEKFFTSLGFEPLPQSFWERSLLTCEKPRDRNVVCHASAWSIDFNDDMRFKKCVEVNAEAFATVHHELGHNFYQRAYNGLSPLFQDCTRMTDFTRPSAIRSCCRSRQNISSKSGSSMVSRPLPRTSGCCSNGPR